MPFKRERPPLGTCVLCSEMSRDFESSASLPLSPESRVCCLRPACSEPRSPCKVLLGECKWAGLWSLVWHWSQAWPLLRAQQGLAVAVTPLQFPYVSPATATGIWHSPNVRQCAQHSQRREAVPFFSLISVMMRNFLRLQPCPALPSPPC